MDEAVLARQQHASKVGVFEGRATGQQRPLPRLHDCIMFTRNRIASVPSAPGPSSEVIDWVAGPIGASRSPRRVP